MKDKLIKDRKKIKSVKNLIKISINLDDRLFKRK